MATLATWVAGLCKHPALSSGERGVLLIVAQDQRTADVVFEYVLSNVEASPILRQLMQTSNQRVLRLSNNVSIEVRAADFRNLRGLTFITAIADEVAFWQTSDASSNPDVEILRAIRPGLLTTNGPLIMISSPYARRGSLFDEFDHHFGAKGDRKILVAQAASKIMNPGLEQSQIDREYEKDPASASAEYGAQFRTDIKSFVSLDAVRAVVEVGVHERLPKPGVAYLAFCDPSGGQIDSMTLCVAHLDYISEIVVIDRLVEVRSPCSAEIASTEFAAIMKTYGLSTCYGDKYGQVWVREQFSRVGIAFLQEADGKSQLYGSLLAAINSRRVSLLDNARLISQLCSLERITGRGGHDTIDHPKGALDDIANACAGATSMLLSRGVFNWAAMGHGTSSENDTASWRQWRCNNTSIVSIRI